MIGGGFILLDGRQVGVVDSVRVDYDRTYAMNSPRAQEHVVTGVDIYLRLHSMEDARDFVDRITGIDPISRDLRSENRRLLELLEAAEIDPANPTSPAQRAASALARVRKLHWHEHADTSWGGQCGHCQGGRWPCETIEALEGTS